MSLTIVQKCKKLDDERLVAFFESKLKEAQDHIAEVGLGDEFSARNLAYQKPWGYLAAIARERGFPNDSREGIHLLSAHQLIKSAKKALNVIREREDAAERRNQNQPPPYRQRPTQEFLHFAH